MTGPRQLLPEGICSYLQVRVWGSVWRQAGGVEPQDLPLPQDCPLLPTATCGETFRKSPTPTSARSLRGQRWELTDGLWIQAYDKVTEGGFVLKCLLLNISMKARHVPVACNQIADSPSLSFPAISCQVTGTGGERTATSWPSSHGWTPRLRRAGGAVRMRSALSTWPTASGPPELTAIAFSRGKSIRGSQTGSPASGTDAKALGGADGAVSCAGRPLHGTPTTHCT